MKTKPTQWPTRNDLPLKKRNAVAILLNQQLADLIDLGLQVKQAHWNVKGPQFSSLHALFDEVAGELGTAADDVAERAVELGSLAEGTLQQVSAVTRLPAYPPALLQGRDHLESVAGGIALVAASTRSAIDAVASLGDASSADVLTEVSRSLDKLLWKVEAHLIGG